MNLHPNLASNNILTIVFGKSGTGKTSLLNTGVFPRSRKDYNLPFRIRLEFEKNSPDLISQIKNVQTYRNQKIRLPGRIFSGNRIAIREEYLPEFENIASTIPSIKLYGTQNFLRSIVTKH